MASQEEEGGPPGLSLLRSAEPAKPTAANHPATVANLDGSVTNLKVRRRESKTHVVNDNDGLGPRFNLP